MTSGFKYRGIRVWGYTGREAFLPLLCGLLVVGTVGQAASVPFSETFDGPLATQGWVTTGDGSATVSGGSVSLQDITLSNAFTPEENAVVINVVVKPLFSERPPRVPPNRFKFYVNTNGLVTAYDGSTPTNLTHTPLVEGVSATFQIRVDYPLQSWALSVNGATVATDLHLASSTPESTFETVGFVEGSTNAFSYVDSVTVQSAESASFSVLPFEEPFNALTNGALNGQRDWVSTDAAVQSSVARGGKACSITSGSGRIEHTFIGGHTNVWTKLDIRPVRGEPRTPPTGTTFAYYVNSNGVVMAYNGNTATNLPAVVPADTWVRFETHTDYANTNWDLYLNGSRIAENLDFFSGDRNWDTAFGVYGVATGVTYVDNVYLGKTRGTSSPGSVLILR